MLTKESG